MLCLKKMPKSPKEPRFVTLLIAAILEIPVGRFIISIYPAFITTVTFESFSPS